MSHLQGWTSFLWSVHLVCCTFGMAVNERADEICPVLQVEDRRFSDSLDRPLAITGFDLTENSVFPNGLPSEYSFVTIFRLRRTTKKDRWFLWQIFDPTGGTQVSVVVDGAKRSVEFSFQGLQRNTLHYHFKSRDLHVLFDRQWHKLGVSVQSTAVSVYVDCVLVERRLTEDKSDINRSGRTLITTRVEDGRPVDIELQQILIYCDPYIAEMENCCELLESKLPLMLSRAASKLLDGCQCLGEKGDTGLPGLNGLPGLKGGKGDKV
ncbi:hypothetical protein NHX12_022893 [Muraenolepis orangiensis]|uniref:Thrombospondin-like N-terminal domain-containing protein n=1 Tax=Muraenolepis orangiensis TaxID=630683 RepID=A0A9Q0EUC9_9TELE|nr:hypothetical protein NHX12_022893 [Muraenolepis orangiensis]